MGDCIEEHILSIETESGILRVGLKPVADLTIESLDRLFIDTRFLVVFGFSTTCAKLLNDNKELVFRVIILVESISNEMFVLPF